MNKQSPYLGYTPRYYKKVRKPVNFNQHDRFLLIDNRNRCQQDEIFGKPREIQCDCQACTIAFRLMNQYRRGYNICKAFAIPFAETEFADFIAIMLSDEDIFEIARAADPKDQVGE